MSASAGIVLIIPKGEYDGTVTYNMLNLVTYQNGSYLAKQTTTGNLPTDTTYWQKMVSVDDMTGASAGAAGVHGLVPAPAAGDQAKFLQGDGTWATVDLSSKADQTVIGGSYNAATAYEPGDRFSYNGVRYKVIIESGTVQGQTPPNATYYEVCSVDDDIITLNNSLTEINTSLDGKMDANAFITGTYYVRSVSQEMPSLAKPAYTLGGGKIIFDLPAGQYAISQQFFVVPTFTSSVTLTTSNFVQSTNINRIEITACEADGTHLASLIFIKSEDVSSEINQTLAIPDAYRNKRLQLYFVQGRSGSDFTWTLTFNA